MTRRPPVEAQEPTRRAGTVVANYGRTVEIADADGMRHPCRLHGRRLETVCGDVIEWDFAPNESTLGIVYGIAPRERVLERLTSLGRRETIVANLTQVATVVATRPEPDWEVVDRYLAGAEWAGLAALVVFNKIELGASATMRAELDALARVGYRIVETSTRAEPGVAALAGELSAATSVLVGQSGTGKSSLLNALVPHARAVTQEISAATEEGKHTTTHAALHELEGGGRLIDSPGVRDYAPPLPAPRDVGSGFREIASHAAGCRFDDCRHVTEPACAVRAAVESGEIHRRRYDSYRHLHALAVEFEARFPRRRPAEGRDRRPR